MPRLSEPLKRFEERLAARAAAVERGDALSEPEVSVPSPVVRAQAIALVQALGRLSFETFGELIELPDLSPCDDGSIDLHWGYGTDRELLLGIKPTAESSASFFGRAPNGTSIKGTIDAQSTNLFLVAWLLAK